MPGAKSTMDLRVELRMILDRVLGLDSFKKRLVQEVQKFSRDIDKDINIKPKLDLDTSSIEEAINKLRAYQKELGKELKKTKTDAEGNEVLKLQGEDRKLFQDVYRRVGLYRRALDTQITDRGPLAEALKDKRFVRVIEDVRKGYYTDARGKRQPLTGVDFAALAGPEGPRDAKGKKLFEPSDLNNLRLYRQEMGAFSGTLDEVQRGLAGLDKPIKSLAIADESEALKERAAQVKKTVQPYRPTKADLRRYNQEQLEAASEFDKTLRENAVRRYTALKGLRDRESIEKRKQLRKELGEYGLYSKALIREEQERLKKQDKLRRAAAKKENARLERIGEQRRAKAIVSEAGGVAGVTRVQDARFVRGATNKTIARMEGALNRLRTKFDSLGEGPERDKVGRFVKRLEDRLEAAYTDADNLNRKVRELSKVGAAAGVTADRTRRKEQEPRGASPKLGEEVFRRRGGFGAADRATRGELPELAAYATAEIRRLEAAQAKLSKGSSDYTKNQAKMNRQLDLMNRELTRARVRMNGFYGATNQAASLFRQFFRYALGYGALYQALQAVRALTMGLVDLETQLKAIQAVTAATRDEINTIEGGIKQVALTTQFNTVEIAQAAQILGQAGVIPKELPKAIEATALFASATGSSIEIAADLVTSLRNVFTTLEDNTITNLLTRAINISKLTAEDLKTVVSLSSQIAKSYNLTAEQYFAAVTTLRNAGIKPSTVATGLRQGLIELFSPDSKTVKALVSRYRQLGEQLNEEAVRGKFFAFTLEADPLVSVLRELQRLGFRGEGKQTFQRAYDIRAENAINALIDDIEQLEEASSQLTFGNAAAVAAATQMEALSHSMRNLGAAISVFIDDVAGGILPVIEDWVDGLTAVIQKYDDLHNTMRRETGLGLEAGAIGGAVGTLAGAALYRGQVLGRIASAGIGGVIGSRLGAGFAEQRLPEDIKVEEGIPTGFGEHLKELASFILLAMIPTFGRIIRNWYGGAGFTNAIRQAFGAGGAASAVADATLSASVMGLFGKIGRAVSSLKVGKSLAPSVGPEIDRGLLAYRRIVAVLQGLGRFLLRHPVAVGVTLLYTVAQAASRFFDPRDMKKTAAQLEAATKARERAQNEFDKIEDELANFRPSDAETGYKAREGTTAASIENLEEQVARADSQLTGIFEDYGDRVNEFSEHLLRLSNEGAISGSTIRTSIQDYLVRPADRGGFGSRVRPDASLEDLDARLSAAAADSSAFIRGVETIRNEWVRYIQQLASKSSKDLTQLQRIQLDSVNQLLQDEEDFASIFYGYYDAGTPRETAERVKERIKQFNAQVDELYRSSEEFQAFQTKLLESRAYEIREFLDRVRDLNPDSPDFQNALQGVMGALVGFDKTVIDHLNETKRLIQEGSTTASRLAEQADLRARLEDIRGSLKFLESQPDPLYDEDARLIKRRTIEQLKEQERIVASQIVTGRGLVKLEEQQEKDQESAAASTAVIDRQLENITKTNRKRELAEESIIRTLQERSQDQEFLDAFRQYREPAPPGVQPTPEQLSAEALQGRVFGATPESLVKVGEEGALEYSPLIGADKDNLAGVLNAVVQLQEKRRGDQAFSTVTQPPLLEKIETARFAVEQAEAQKRYEELGREVEGTTNLYRALQVLLNQERDYKIRQLNRESDFLGRDSEKAKRNAIEIQKLENDKKREITNTNIKIENARNKTSSEYLRQQSRALRDQIEALNRTLAGQRKRLQIALDNGSLVAAQDADREILKTKEQILQKRVEELQLQNATNEEIDNFRRRYREDMIPAFDSSSVLRRFFAGQARQLEYAAPESPRLSPDAREAGRLEQRGVVAEAPLISEALDVRIAEVQKDLDERQKLLDKQMNFVGPLLDPGTIQTTIEGVRELNEELGRLEEIRDGLSLNTEGFIKQLDLGLDLGQIASGIRELDSYFTNLGSTIQNDIVGGLDNAADSFANALVRGESFADGVRQALSDMAYQVAADIVKSGVMTMIATLIGGAVGGPSGAAAGSTAGSTSSSGSFLDSIASFFGFSKGGVIEAKAEGGIVGQKKDGSPIRNAVNAVSNFVKYASGGVVRGLAGGGVIKGPGTGTSDSIPGVVVNKQGRAVRGIKVSHGESILTAKTTGGLGKAGIDKLNDLSNQALARVRAFLGAMSGYRDGGVIERTFSAADITRLVSTPPLAFAAGGTIGNMTQQVSKMDMPVTGQESSGHTYRAEVLVGAQEGTEADPDTLRRLDEGITLKIQNYIQEQRRPGGLLETTRVRATGIGR